MTRTLSTGLLLLAGTLMELCFLSLYLAPAGPSAVLFLIAVNVVTYLLLAFLVLRPREAAGGDRARLLLIAGFGVLFRLSLVPHGVIGSDDIYRYLWDGHVAAAGINPFAYTPTDPHLASLATADLPAKVNHPELRSVYPALAQGLFLLSHALFGDAQWGIKLLLTAADTMTILFIWLFVRARASAVLPLLLYAWSPLPVLYFGLDGHIDALAIPFLILALVCFCSGKPVRGMLAVGAGALAKLVPLLAIPLMFRELRGWRRFLLPLIPPLMVGAGVLLYYEPSWGVVDSLKTFGSRWEFNGGIFSVAYFLTDSNEAAHIVSAVLIALYIGALALVDRPLLEKVFWGFTGFVLLSPVVHPWYLTWLAALLALRWSPAVFLLLGMSVCANVVVYQYRAFGQWIDQPWLLAVEYVPVFVLLAREILRGEFLRSPHNGPAA